MNKVEIINLNGKAYQLEESGYALLKAYLDEAEQKLASNPDKIEIMADFEQAIAEKADARLTFQKTVVTEVEIKEIIQEMGPVADVGDTKHEQESQAKPNDPSSPKRFYRVREGSVIGGVCTGIAAYFNIDVILVRIIVVVLALATQGLVLIAYLIAMIAVPMADTDEKLAAAYGVPFNAQELMDRAKNEYGSAKQQWKKWQKNRRNEWRNTVRRERMDMMRPSYSAGNIILQTIFGLIAAGLTICWILGLVLLFTTGNIFGFFLVGVPIWIMAILFTIIYGIIVSPFHHKQWYTYGHGQNGCHTCCHGTSGGGLIGILFMALGLWAIYHFVPASQPVFIQIGEAFRLAWTSVREALGK